MYVSCMYLSCMSHVSCMYVPCMYASCMSHACHVCIMHVSCMYHACVMYVCIIYVSCMSRSTCMSHACQICIMYHASDVSCMYHVCVMYAYIMYLVLMHSELPMQMGFAREKLETNWDALRTACAILGLLDCLGLELVGGNRRGGEQERWLPGRHCPRHGAAELSSHRPPASWLASFNLRLHWLGRSLNADTTRLSEPSAGNVL